MRVCVCVFPHTDSALGEYFCCGESDEQCARYEFEQLVQEAPAVNRAD